MCVNLSLTCLIVGSSGGVSAPRCVLRLTTCVRLDRCVVLRPVSEDPSERVGVISFRILLVRVVLCNSVRRCGVLLRQICMRLVRVRFTMLSRLPRIVRLMVGFGRLRGCGMVGWVVGAGDFVIGVWMLVVAVVGRCVVVTRRVTCLSTSVWLSGPARQLLTFVVRYPL